MPWVRVPASTPRVITLLVPSSGPIYFSLVLWFSYLQLVGEFYQSLKLSSVLLVCLFYLFMYVIYLYTYFFNPRPEGLFTRLCGNLYFKPCCVLFAATDCFFRSPSQEVQNSTRKRTFKVQAPANVCFYHYDR